MTGGALDDAIPGFRPDQLEGFRIGVTSERRAADLIDALERRGAHVMHAPTLRMEHARDDEQVIADTRDIIGARPDVVLATTAFGIRRWLEVADAAGLGEELLDTMAASRILVRGPKARGSIRAAGLDDAGMSEEETTISLVAKVLAEHPTELTVAVQAHGYLDDRQLDPLRAAGHRVLLVAPYRWKALDDSDERIPRLVEAICQGQLDCVTFTSAPAVDALYAAADGLGAYDALLAAFRRGVVAAAVGPVTAAPLASAGIEPIQPERYRMGALIRLVCERLPELRIARARTAHGDVVMRGSIVELDGRRIPLTPTPLALLRTLLDADGAVVSREQLLRAVGTADEHALEMALSRLRRSLGAPIIRTVVKRGYRLDVAA
ncbi:uroporphyrinogen-III synthase [Protaetiibacter intestinalis]|uniref:Uroporphyrinogen-III synthase n=1 Tax=Protaetiibacter intestinalis TaxID=2419774 RepID=A0A387B9R4_9MICO|nr:uroporphyrinogen-III synthase [Protaetiibacter intestinalis]AYF98591.1 uroporphyrinogen-III synthase [Protaetiibacter intestinalis]